MRLHYSNHVIGRVSLEDLDQGAGVLRTQLLLPDVSALLLLVRLLASEVVHRTQVLRPLEFERDSKLRQVHIEMLRGEPIWTSMLHNTDGRKRCANKVEQLRFADPTLSDSWKTLLLAHIVLGLAQNALALGKRCMLNRWRDTDERDGWIPRAHSSGEGQCQTRDYVLRCPSGGF